MREQKREILKKIIFDILIITIFLGYIFYGTYPKHGDFLVMNYVATSFAVGNYDFYTDIIEVQHLPKSYVAYPPIWYLLQGIYIKILSLIFSYDLHNWTAESSIIPSFMPLFGILPNIILFFIGGLVIFKVYKQRELVLLYLLSPLAFVSINIMGHIDIYSAFFTLLALYFAKKSFDTAKPLLGIASIISLGIGAEFKIYPLLLLIPMVMFLTNKNILKSLEYIGLGIVISLIPWVGYIKWFKFITLDGETNFLFNLQLSPINLPPFHTISVFVVGYCILLWILLRYINVSFRNLLGSVFITCSWFFITVYTHPQWWVWILPISIFVLGEFRDRMYRYLYVVLNLVFILYPMMWVNNIDIPLRNYIPTIAITGNNNVLVVSIIVSILLIWSLELLNATLNS